MNNILTQKHFMLMHEQYFKSKTFLFLTIQISYSGFNEKQYQVDLILVNQKLLFK